MGNLCVSKQSTDTPDERLSSEPVQKNEPPEEVVVFKEEKEGEKPPANGTAVPDKQESDKQPLINNKDEGITPAKKDLAAKNEPTTAEPPAKSEQKAPSSDAKEKQPPAAKSEPKQQQAAAATASKAPEKKKQLAPAKKEEVKKKPPKEQKKEQKKEKPIKTKDAKKASPPFVSLVDASKRVALESCSPAKRTFLGVVQVYNQAFVKDVAIRFTFDGWSTQHDLQAVYLDSHYEVSTDRFKFVITREGNSAVEFAISYSVEDCEYWDNNNEKNYVFK